MPTLLIRGPDGTLVEKELDSRLTVGCDEDNDLVVRSNGVEKRHANFFAEGGEVVLEELHQGGRKKLQPGVRVVIGDYQVELKDQKVSVRKVEAPPPAPAVFPFKVVFTLFGVALAVIVAAGVYRRLDQQQPVVTPPPPPVDACADPEKWLRVAREAPSKRGLDAVEKVLECDPLHEEANRLKRSIPKELEGQEALTRAKEFVELDRDEQALEQLDKIAADTEVARTALPLVTEVHGRVYKAAQKDCDEYTKAKKSSIAQPRCELAKRLLPKGPPPSPAGPSLSQRLIARLQEPLLAEALVLYADGRSAEAQVKLQKIRERSSLAHLHARAEELRKDISNADGLYKVGERALEKGNLESATRAFKEALDLDAKILPEGGSTLRKKAEQSTAQKAYEQGAALANRQQWVRACETWKLGFSFFRGNSDLAKAVTACTNRAAELLGSDKCKDLDEAAAIAVEGDTLGPQIAAKRSERGCQAQ